MRNVALIATAFVMTRGDAPEIGGVVTDAVGGGWIVGITADAVRM